MTLRRQKYLCTYLLVKVNRNEEANQEVLLILTGRGRGVSSCLHIVTGGYEMNFSRTIVGILDFCRCDIRGTGG
jgi:hypothetical protein